jgi:diadenosine tetraphosphate (Ap4A) HIT family hydrolase
MHQMRKPVSDFSLDGQIAADTSPLLEWPLCRVLLMEDANYPWLILVPARPGLVELHDMNATDRAALMEEIATASKVLKEFSGADKINVAAFGNMVAQLHVHVIARRKTDPAWPRPVWGAAPRQAYLPAEKAALIGGLRAVFALG